MSHTAQHPKSRPPSGIMRRGEVVEVYDGDTLTIRTTTDFRVRLIGCWTAEIRGTEGEERELADAAKANLEELALGQQCEFFIPLDGVDRLDDTLTFGRVLAAAWVGDSEASLSQQQVAAGLASSTKGGQLGE